MGVIGRTLAIDHGKARIGLALSDGLGLTARPLDAVDGKDPAQAVRRIAALVAEEEVARVLIGLPLRMDGTEGPAVAAVREFATALRATLGDVPLEEVDERLTTRQAHAELKSAGVKHKARKAGIDSAAALVLLQGWLAARR